METTDHVELETTDHVERCIAPAVGASRSTTADDPTEAEDAIVRRWRAGDRSAGDELVRAWAPLLRRFFRRRTSHNVDELVQLTLVACVQALDNFEGRSSFRTFLLGIAHRQFMVSLRARRQRELPANSSTDEETPSQVFATQEDRRVVASALHRTSPAFRQVLEMFYWEDLSIGEIADTLNLPTGTVKSRLSRARSMVKASIINQEDEHHVSSSD